MTFDRLNTYSELGLLDLFDAPLISLPRSLLSVSQSIVGRQPTSARLFGMCGGLEADEYVDVGRDFADFFECERESERERERERELPRDGALLEYDVVGREGGIGTGHMNMFSGGSGVLSGVAMLAGKRLKCCELRCAELLSSP